MRIRLIATAIAVIMATGLAAQQDDIQSTIEKQFDAFRADDFGAAFEFASPQLQMMFQSPENFRRMVTQGYPMVWKFDEMRFLDLDQIAGDWWQKVMITDLEGRVHILAYRMIETDAGWRIGGVQILDAPGATA